VKASPDKENPGGKRHAIRKRPGKAATGFGLRRDTPAHRPIHGTLTHSPLNRISGRQGGQASSLSRRRKGTVTASPIYRVITKAQSLTKTYQDVVQGVRQRHAQHAARRSSPRTPRTPTSPSSSTSTGSHTSADDREQAFDLARAKSQRAKQMRAARKPSHRTHTASTKASGSALHLPPDQSRIPFHHHAHALQQPQL